MLEALALGLLQTTWIVDSANGPGTNFTDLPAAIAAAASGDTILVRAGSYSAISIDAKALAIRGAGTGVTVVNGPSQLVLSTPAGAINLLSGITIRGFMWVTNGAHVALLDCEIIGISQATSGSVAMHVGQAEVFAVRCRFTGGDAVGPPSPSPFGGPMYGGHAVTVQPGKLAAYDCDFAGGNVAGVFAGLGIRAGGPGLQLDHAATARVDSCRITGGNAAPPGTLIGIGGDGILVRYGARLQIDARPTDVIVFGQGHPIGGGGAIRLVDSPSYGPSQVTVHGAPTIVGPIVGSVTFGAPDLPPLTVTATTLPSGETDAMQPVNVTFDGLLPSAAFAFVVAFRPDYTSVPLPVLGDLLLDVQSGAFLAGQLDTAGQFQFSFVPAATFGGAVPFPFYMQFAVVEPSGQVRLSNLDARFYSL